MPGTVYTNNRYRQHNWTCVQPEKNVKKTSKMGTVRGTNDNQYCRNVWLSNQQQGLYDQEQTAFSVYIASDPTIEWSEISR